MYCQKIIPITNLPFSQDYFFYYSPSKLPIGSVVEINLKNKNCVGLVLANFSVLKNKKIIKKIPYPLKKINEVIIDFPIINSSLFQLAKFISRYYYCSLPLALKTILPSNLKRFLKFLKKEPIENTFSLNKSAEIIDFNKINFSEINDLKIIKEKVDSLSLNSQVLFLTPTLFHLKYFQEKFPQGTIFQKKDRKSFKIFKGALEGKPLLILGTRSAVFLPFLNLKLIIVNEPENPSYKSWKQKPFYHSSKIAQKLSLYHQAELIFCSPYDT